MTFALKYHIQKEEEKTVKDGRKFWSRNLGKQHEGQFSLHMYLKLFMTKWFLKPYEFYVLLGTC